MKDYKFPLLFVHYIDNDYRMVEFGQFENIDYA